MGYAKKQRDEQRENARANKAVKTRNGIVSFKPTEMDKPIIKALAGDAVNLTDKLIRVLERDIKLSATYMSEQDCFCWIARDGQAAFGEGLAVSFWHKDPVTALAMAAYALTVIYPDYPDNAPNAASSQNDW